MVKIPVSPSSRQTRIWWWYRNSNLQPKVVSFWQVFEGEGLRIILQYNHHVTPSIPRPACLDATGTVPTIILNSTPSSRRYSMRSASVRPGTASSATSITYPTASSCGQQVWIETSRQCPTIHHMDKVFRGIVNKIGNLEYSAIDTSKETWSPISGDLDSDTASRKSCCMWTPLLDQLSSWCCWAQDVREWSWKTKIYFRFPPI